MVLKAIAETKRIASCVFVRSPVVHILYEMTSDMLPNTMTKVKRPIPDIRSIYESNNRFLFAYAPRM